MLLDKEFIPNPWLRPIPNPDILLMVNGWRADCCLGIQIMLGELRLGLPRPELPILLVLPLMPMPCPTCELIMFLVFMGRMPLFGEGGVWRDIVGTPVVGVLWLGS